MYFILRLMSGCRIYSLFLSIEELVDILFRLNLPRYSLELRIFFQVQGIQRWNEVSARAVMKDLHVSFVRELEVELNDRLYNVL